MRHVRYSVAMSLDGFIAGPKGQYDWIVMDPQIDFDDMYGSFDTVLMGRKSFEAAGGGPWAGKHTIVISRTLRQEDHPQVVVWNDRIKQRLMALREQPGGNIWLFGGGQLFGSVLKMGLVDSVEVGLMPVLLGNGLPLLAAPYKPINLKLTNRLALDSGILLLTYDVLPEAVKKSARPKKPATAKRAAKKPAAGGKRRARRKG